MAVVQCAVGILVMRILCQSGRRSVSIAVVFSLAVVMVGGLPVARACALCSEIPGASGVLDVRLLEIVSAIRHEIDSGGLEEASPGAPLPTSGPVLGRRMASLLRHQPHGDQRLELVLIDSGARFRFDPTDMERGFAPVSAKKQSFQPTVRWITGIDVFHALLEQRMGIDTAMVRGILVIEPVSDSDPLLAGAADLPVGWSGEATPQDQEAADSSQPRTILLLGALGILILIPILLALRSNRVQRARMA